MSDNSTQTTEKKIKEDNLTRITTILALSLIFICILIVLLFDNFNSAQYNVLTLLMAISTSTFVVTLPGTIEINLDDKLKATGALGVFVLVVGLMYYTADYRKYEIFDVQGKIILEDQPENLDVFADLTFSYTPPDVIRNQKRPNGFRINSLAVDKESSDNALLTITKKGYIRTDIPIEINKDLKETNPYIINKSGKVYTIDFSRSPIILKKDKTITSRNITSEKAVLKPATN